MTATPTTPFAAILCAVDGSRASGEAARQAVALAGPETTITFLAVTWRVGKGLGEMATLGPRRAERALERASELAQEHEVRCSTRLAEGPTPIHGILEAARDHDLLVLGAPSHPRHAGILIGSTATAAAHRGEGPILLARKPPRNVPFPKRMLVATDGTRSALPAVDVATAIAAAQQTELTFVHLDCHDGDALHGHGLVKHTALAYERLGVEPEVRTSRGHPHSAIAQIAREDRVSLVAIGSRGLTGTRALASVSERVAHGAPCSVLIVRPRVAAGQEPRRVEAGQRAHA